MTHGDLALQGYAVCKVIHSMYRVDGRCPGSTPVCSILKSFYSGTNADDCMESL